MKLQLKHCYAYTPEQLWDAFVAYVREYSIPAVITQYGKGGNNLGEAYEVEVERPLSIKGFCAHSQIATISRGWDNAIDEILRSDNPACAPYREVANLIADLIETQVLEGGMLGKFNASLVTNSAKGQFNRAYMQDASGGVSKIEHTINFKSFNKTDNGNKTD